MNRFCLWLALLGILSSTPDISAQSTPAETPAQRDARMQWWRQARFGMFIHWGLYAIPAGQWDGKPVPGIGEWIMDRANIPRDQYEKLAAQFNPVKYDPAQWARIAAEAGMKYLVITSKHHDGFCLFDSKATKYDVVDATPYGKDLLRPLAAECRKQGIRFCVYYSIMDWHHPAQERGKPEHYNPTKIVDNRKAEYVGYMKQQLREIIECCDPGVIWFDGEWPEWWTEPDGQDLYAYLRGLNPRLIINNRVGKGRKGMEGISKGDQKYAGDFGTPEQQIPATGLPGVDWESCMTMNETWGFKRDDQKWKSAETLIRNLIDIASKGGNYLLNVGPTAEGEIPAASVERLAAMGRWMGINGESIYGTEASPIGRPAWGRCTKKVTGGKTTVYLHVFQWPADGKLIVEGLSGTPKSACLLQKEQRPSVKFQAEGGRLVLSLPSAAPDVIASVIALEM